MGRSGWRPAGLLALLGGDEAVVAAPVVGVGLEAALKDIHRCPRRFNAGVGAEDKEEGVVNLAAVFRFEGVIRGGRRRLLQRNRVHARRGRNEGRRRARRFSRVLGRRRSVEGWGQRAGPHGPRLAEGRDALRL